MADGRRRLKESFVICYSRNRFFDNKFIGILKIVYFLFRNINVGKRNYYILRSLAFLWAALCVSQPIKADSSKHFILFGSSWHADALSIVEQVIDKGDYVGMG